MPSPYYPKKLVEAFENDTDYAPKRKPGRPPKSKADAIAVARNALLGSGNAEKIAKKMLQIAMADDHKDQMTALKWLGDRLAPQSLYEKAQARAPQIVLNISAANPRELPFVNVQEVPEIAHDAG